MIRLVPEGQPRPLSKALCPPCNAATTLRSVG